MTTVNNPVIQGYLDSLGQRLAPGFGFQFSVIVEDPCVTTHEPITTPGGFVFVPLALFRAAQNEDEFAGMLAHAMTHAARRDWMVEPGQGRLASVPLVFVGGGNCSVPMAAVQARERQELAADELALQTMAR